MTGDRVRLERSLRVVEEADVCVVGGGPAGVFAAVRAARLGMRVTLIEQAGALGGTSCLAQVNEWHSLHDAAGAEQIVRGLLEESLEGLRRRGVVTQWPPGNRIAYRFNAAELSVGLEELARQAGVRIRLVTTLVDALRDEEGAVSEVVVGDRAGLSAIRAAAFVDASGDGALLAAAGLAWWRGPDLQPVSAQFTAAGLGRATEAARATGGLWRSLRSRFLESGLPDSDPWPGRIPGTDDVWNVLGSRIHGVDATDPVQLSEAMLGGHRLARGFVDVVAAATEGPGSAALVGLAPLLGVRQTRQADTGHRVTQQHVLSGTVAPDAIAVGVYPVDIHHPGGTVLRYLDGTQEDVTPSGQRSWSRWREPGGADPLCYTVPFAALVPRGSRNVIAAGRLVDADAGAYGALRVVVVCAQFGEAAGIAAARLVSDNCALSGLDVGSVQDELRSGGTRIPSP